MNDWDRSVVEVREQMATSINTQINTVAAFVDAFRTRVGTEEITTLEQAEAFMGAWLEGMRQLQQ